MTEILWTYIDCDVVAHKHSSRTYWKRRGLTASTLIHGPNCFIQHLRYECARLHTYVSTLDAILIPRSSSILSRNRGIFVCVRIVTNIKSNLDVSNFLREGGRVELIPSEGNVEVECNLQMWRGKINFFCKSKNNTDTMKLRFILATVCVLCFQGELMKL